MNTTIKKTPFLLRIFGVKNREEKMHELDEKFVIFIVHKQSESFLKVFEEHMKKEKFTGAFVVPGYNEKYVIVYRHAYHHFNDFRKGLGNIQLDEVTEQKRKEFAFEAVRWL